MYGFLQVLTFFALAHAGVSEQAYAPAWPETKAGPVVDTPDWSDYRVYPLAARRKDQEGRVTAELLVGPDGKPQDCRIVITSYFPELDSGTCDLMLQMRFMPARDFRGNTVPSRFIRRFNWRLTDPIKFGSAFLRVRVSLNEGKLRECGVKDGAGPYLAFWSSSVCTFLADTPYYFGARRSGEALVEFRLDANDQADFLRRPWISKEAAALERIIFTINDNGDASQCSASEQYGFGTRGLNNMSPCGRLLSILWFERAMRNTPQRTGTFETRVFLEGAHP
jgi:TonB family protein